MGNIQSGITDMDPSNTIERDSKSRSPQPGDRRVASRKLVNIGGRRPTQCEHETLDAGAGPAKKIETTREKPQFAGFIDQFKMQIVTELSAIGALSASKTVECERYNARLVNGYARIWLLVSGFSIAFTPRP